MGDTCYLRRYVSSDRWDTCGVWSLDWDLEDREPTDWDNGAKPYLENFLTLHSSRIATKGGFLGLLEVTHWDTPKWTERGFPAVALHPGLRRLRLAAGGGRAEEAGGDGNQLEWAYPIRQNQ